MGYGRILRWGVRLGVLVIAVPLLVIGGLAGFVTLYDPPPRPDAPATIVVFSGSQLADGRMGRTSRQRVATAIALYRPGDVMLLTGKKTIRDVILFPVLRPEVQ